MSHVIIIYLWSRSYCYSVIKTKKIIPMLIPIFNFKEIAQDTLAKINHLKLNFKGFYAPAWENELNKLCERNLYSLHGQMFTITYCIFQPYLMTLKAARSEFFNHDEVTSCYNKIVIYILFIINIYYLYILYKSQQCSMNRSIAQIPQCTSPLPHHAPYCDRNVHVCTFLSQNGALWDICLMHCGICDMGLFYSHM